MSSLPNPAAEAPVEVYLICTLTSFSTTLSGPITHLCNEGPLKFDCVFIYGTTFFLSQLLSQLSDTMEGGGGDQPGFYFISIGMEVIVTEVAHFRKLKIFHSLS